MSQVARIVVDRAMESVDCGELPQVLLDQIEQHKEHLISLAGHLLSGGQDAESVRQIVTTVLDSFREELLRTLTTLREDKHA